MTRGRWISVAAVGGFIGLWELAGQLEWIDPVLTSYPSRIGVAAGRLMGSGDIAADTLFTLRVFFSGLTVAVVAGVAVGVVIGFSRAAHDALNPFIVTASALPKIVLMPLIVLWLGVGFSANVFLGALMGSFPMIMAVHAGVRSLDRDLMVLARSFGASRRLTFRAVVLPGVTPFVLGGLRVAVSYTMVGALIAEFFASSEGLGYRMVAYMSNFNVDEFFVCICVVAVVVMVCQGLVQWLERRVEGWRPPMAATTAGM